MDIKALLYNLREEVCCSVCTYIYTDPKQLPCLHSFCLQCLKQWHRKGHGRDTIRCPKWQALVRVPESGDLNDLPTSFYLNGLIDVLAIRECKTSQVKCGNCDKTSSESSYCFQCCAFYCQECVIGHNMWKSYRDHRILALKAFQHKDYEDVMKRPAFCPKKDHNKEELKYFCKSCEMPACQVCSTLDHGGHNMKLIKEEAEIQRTEMMALVEKQRRNLQAKMEAVNRLDEEFAKLMQQGEDIIRNVETFVDSLMAVIEAKKQNILSSVEKETSTSLELITERKTEVQTQIKAIESSLKNADKLLSRSTNAEIVQLKKSLDAIFERVDQTEPVDCDTRSLSAGFVFEKNQKVLDTVKVEQMGTLQCLQRTKASQSIAEGRGLEEGFMNRQAKFTLTSRNACGKQFYNERDHVTVEIRDEQGRECAAGLRINDFRDGLYQISFTPKEQGRCKVKVKVNGEHVCSSPFTVQVKPFQFTPVLSFGVGGSSIGMFRHPWAVAVNAKDEIAVTDYGNNRIQIFNSDGNYIRSFGCQGSNQEEFIQLMGIAFHNNGNIFVANSLNHRIEIVTVEGKYVGSFGECGNLDHQLNSPWGLSVDSDGNIIVTDRGNSLIKIFSHDGKFLMKTGGQGFSKFLRHCIQYDRYLIVSDSGEHCIKVFDRNGNFQYKFGKNGIGDGEFYNPGFMSVNKSGHLMVCDECNHRVQVFETNGKFIGKFGTKGSNLGEFQSPLSLAILSNDRIAVCDTNNHRVQMFE
ncbi:E3 ubiquitin-protein ligase TRIM71-like isoform X3 [Stylophora pistillata]|uniref:E3 ubiquitin-protein ligase TRIM71-like isoform X1 n=1 Tax=Stylophora pistillata TaxID=50429 RepID=UPI000C04E728|nr:E3 ubiquitin-protein ligase TRIM71-like isoform X1 [Stylophora pistillata]XP_022785325.1 E3 ubiquitin-protein ligase TRIM71-like isoform X2 [Stylophora pistillata]XP_022785326.1 E3 ubiquitin-protein ligase TRIM71-like isoform X3 [Stylophora pistillata]